MYLLSVSACVTRKHTPCRDTLHSRLQIPSNVFTSWSTLNNVLSSKYYKNISQHLSARNSTGSILLCYIITPSHHTWATIHTKRLVNHNWDPRNTDVEQFTNKKTWLPSAPWRENTHLSTAFNTLFKTWSISYGQYVQCKNRSTHHQKSFWCRMHGLLSLFKKIKTVGTQLGD